MKYYHMKKSRSFWATSPETYAKYYRQKCINILEKLTKNLFRMLRDSSTTKEQLCMKFFELKEKLDGLGNVYLDTEYHSQTRKYIELLANRLQWNFDLEKLRSKQMTELNRLQKLKNTTSYKRKKKIKPYEI